MPTQEIPREEWQRFFNIFSRQHEGWLATLEVFAKDVGAQVEVDELPLEGVSLESDNSETIAVSFAKSPDDHINHMIDKPSHVWLEQTGEGANAALEIQSEDNSKTLLRFRAAVPPEFVDGVVPD
jgi:hypothetical protein